MKVIVFPENVAEDSSIVDVNETLDMLVAAIVISDCSVPVIKISSLLDAMSLIIEP